MKLKLKVSGVMLKHLKKEISKDYMLVLERLDINHFKILVDYDVMDHIEDYDHEKEVFKVFKVLYPDDYYCMPRYITSSDLVKMYGNTASGTWSEFVKEFNNCIEV